MVVTKRRIAVLLVALAMLLGLALAGPATGHFSLPTFGPEMADAGKRCRDNHHYHWVPNEQHWVYNTSQVGPNQIYKYWKAQQLDTGATWKIGRILC